MRDSKVCPKCNVDRPLDRYYDYGGQCKNCRTVWQTEYYRKKPAKRGLNYHLTPADYDRMHAEQGGLCAICGTYKPGGKCTRLVVDHCHTTGKVRGLLCNSCNTGIGLLRDNPDRVAAAAKYLRDAGTETDLQS